MKEVMKVLASRANRICGLKALDVPWVKRQPPSSDAGQRASGSAVSHPVR